MKQFGRMFRLEIGNDKEGFAIENLRVAFEFEKSIDSKPNAAKIKIWNLNRDHINQTLAGEFKQVSLAVGYSELRLIYLGNIDKTKIRREGMDWVMELECGDGLTDYQKAYTALTLKAGSNDRDAVKKICEQFEETRVGTVDLPRVCGYPRAKVLMGNNRDLLSQVCQNNEADWSIQDGELLVLPPDKVLNDEAVLLSQDTGMINAPEVTDNGLEVTCLLNPSLKVGGLVRVQSILDYYNGDYKIVNIKYSGDAIGGEWQCKLVVVGGKFQKVEKK